MTATQFEAYLAARDKQYVDRIVEKLNAMTDREKALVSEAAVMGWVQGVRHAKDEIPIPTTPVILAKVLGDIDAFKDLYPFLAALPRRIRKRPRR